MRASGSRPKKSWVALLVAARLPELVLSRPQGHDLTAMGAAPHTVVPGPQPASQVLGLEAKHVADVLEGEQPGAVGVLDPLLRLLEELLAARIARAGLPSIHVDGVLEHSDHESPLAVVLGPAAYAIEELRRQQRIGLEHRPEPLVGCVFTFLHSSGHPNTEFNTGYREKWWCVLTTVP